MIYRGVVDANNILIAFGLDTNQSGNYNDVGTWCDFTFEEFPETTIEDSQKMLFKVVNNVIVARTQEEVDSE